MKNFLLFMYLVLFTASIVLAQGSRGRHPFMPHEKIDQLEKIKLIEILEMDEETSVRFFSRRNEHMQKQRELMILRDSLMMKVEDNFSEENESLYKEQLIQILNLEEQIYKGRKNFFESLNDILSNEQILKVVVFEHRFKQEIRDLLFKGKHGRGMDRE